MSYSNEFLRNFRPVFLAILKAQSFRPERVELVVIDEERSHVFEPADVRDVLEQIGDDLNYLTVYTGRPAYFSAFAERMYEENGLVVMVFPKTRLSAWEGQAGVRETFLTRKVILDFEWEGAYRTEMICAAATYIPIHKKPWKQGENLDIMVPIGENTVIVKGMHHQREKLGRDRFEEAFYEN